MPESQIQAIKDVYRMTPRLSIEFLDYIKNEMEKEIDAELLKLDPSVLLENMDITEKTMLLDYLNESNKSNDIDDSEDTISFEELLKREGLSIDELQD